MFLNFLGIPEAPINLTLVNVTHNSITLSWIPSFDGGYEQSFRIRYKVIKSDYFSSLLPSTLSTNSIRSNEVKSNSEYFYSYPINGSTVFTLTALEPASDYIITISSRNKLGESLISREFIRTRTLSVPIVIDRDNLDNSVGGMATVGERKSDVKLIAGMGTTLIIIILLVAGSIGCLTFSWALLVYYKRNSSLVQRTVSSSNHVVYCVNNSSQSSPPDQMVTSNKKCAHQVQSQQQHSNAYHSNQNESTLQGMKYPSELTNGLIISTISSGGGCNGGNGNGNGNVNVDFVSNCSTDIPFVISSNTVGLCKCDTTIPLMVIEEKLQLSDLTDNQDKCYSFTSKFLLFSLSSVQ